MFPCVGCGECCKRMNIAIETYELLLGEKPDFPYAVDKKGRCSQLTKDNKCKVYANRPLICNVDKMADKLNVEKPHYYMLNIASCNTLIAKSKSNYPFII